MNLIDIHLTVKGPQGCGKTNFIEHMLPRIAETAEKFFCSEDTDIMATATEKQVPRSDKIRDGEKVLDAIKYARHVRIESEKKLAELLKELGVDKKSIEMLEKLNAQQVASEEKLEGMLKAILALSASMKAPV